MDKRWLPNWWWAIVAGALAGIALRFIFNGAPGDPFTPMLGSFALIAPCVVSAVAVYLAERTSRHSWGEYAGIGAAANALFVLGTFAILIEGLICAVLVLPMFAIIGAVAGLLMGAVCRFTHWPRRAMYSVAALPLLLGGFEHRLPLPQDIHTVSRSRAIDAAPADVWAQLMTAQSIRPEELDDAWMYRIGVPVPESAVSERADDRIVRRVRMGKGIRFEQVATDWETDRRVRWEYRFTPDSFPPRALDDHVRIGGDYFDLIDTEYTLEPAGGGTVLHVAMRYRVSTRFNWYARPVAAFIVGDFEEQALRFYARRAQEARAR